LWVDHVEHTGWRDLYESAAGADGGHIIWSVGWLVEDGDDSILVVPHIGEGGGQVDQTGGMEIVRSAIKGIWTLT
jgi:hypothetical protein